MPRTQVGRRTVKSRGQQTLSLYLSADVDWENAVLEAFKALSRRGRKGQDLLRYLLAAGLHTVRSAAIAEGGDPETLATLSIPDPFENQVNAPVLSSDLVSVLLTPRS